MKDRNTQYPGRKKLTIISQSSSEIVADVERYEGTVTEVGTPLNKANILPDTTAESLGLNPEADPTPADALQAIAQALIVPLDIQELYKPLIAPFSVSLTGFVAGSYLLYGKFYDDLRVFVKVSKTTAMSGTTAIGTLPSGYRPAEAQTLTAYDTDGNVVSGITVTIGTNGAVAVVGSVDANAVVMTSYNSQSGVGLTYKDIDRLISQNGAVIESNPNWPNLESSGWKWKKYADGTAELIGKITPTTGTGWKFTTVNLPFTLASADWQHTIGQVGTSALCSVTNSNSGDSRTTTNFQIGVNNGSSTAIVTVHIFGRWK